MPEVKKSSGIHDPNANVNLTINEKSVVSATQNRTTNPKWYENHYFFVDNPDTESLSVSVYDEKSQSQIAKCDIRLSTILNEDGLVVDRGFELDCLQGNFGTNPPKIYMKLSLKVKSFF